MGGVKASLRGAIARLLLLLALCVVSHIEAQDSAFRVVHSVDEVVASVESARHVSAVLLVSTKGDGKLNDLSEEKGEGDDAALVKALEAQFPHVRKFAQSFEGAVEFVVADIADAKAIAKKWNIVSLPALLVYKDAPKANPYTGKMYRQSTPVAVAVLQQPRELKKLLRESIPSTYVTEWTAASGVKTLVNAQTKTREAVKKDDKLVVLVSKQASASPLFRALSVEFESRGLAFAYVNHEEAVFEAMKTQWGIEKLPAMVVVGDAHTFEDRVVLQDDAKMKTYADLKAFVEPFAVATAASDADEKKATSADAEKTAPSSEISMLTASNFDDQVLKSKLVWIVSFMDAETEASVDKKAWQKLMGDVQKKAVAQDQITGEIERADIVEEVFKSVEAAKQTTFDSIPDVVQIIGSAADLNAFVARALAAKAMPVLLVTNKMQTPSILKSLALSFPTQNIAVGVVSDQDPQVKQQFSLPPSSSTSFLCLVPVEKNEQIENQPANTAPFGIIHYDKKTMGSFTYGNMVRYLMSVLMQYPHPKQDTKSADGDAGIPASSTGGADSVGADGLITVPYLRQDNLDELCSGNKICTIGFFDGHVDTLDQENSPLNKAVSLLRQVGTKSTKSRQPFVFMWTNGKCQSAFAESFGVGPFQMPTIVVYSPSKSRYATNIGVFDEENASGFLKGVLSGKIATAPLKELGVLRAECSLEEVSDDAAALSAEEEGDEDLGDLLSEILGDEEKQRRQLEEELAKERKSSKRGGDGKSAKGKSKKKKNKKGKKGKKKGGVDDHDEL